MRGENEVLRTSNDRDDRRDGYDLGLIESVEHSQTMPVLARGAHGTGPRRAGPEGLPDWLQETAS